MLFPSISGLVVGGIANISDTETSIRFVLSLRFALNQENLISFCTVKCFPFFFFRGWFNFHEEFFFMFLLPPIILYSHYVLLSISDLLLL